MMNFFKLLFFFGNWGGETFWGLKPLLVVTSPWATKPNAECRGPPLLISQGATVCIVRSVRNLHISAEKRKEHGPRASVSGHAVGRVLKTQILISNEENNLPTWREKIGIDFTRNRTCAPWAAVSLQVKGTPGSNFASKRCWQSMAPKSRENSSDVHLP